ncbi:hypothetical protein QM467_01445 [Rhodoblastus sp. 17X3]|uniref:hypothetical protein n=1 Tax=Rhodoblastus sp. 17X3 TaxID=3047026 RepID=UPI0024B6B8AB|nr:hypothetical protein [Rhodoblastus sp. 17X3]MDI9846718.1 hypothetical protein [Rhodoblastus sp. 17X3]
MSGFVVNHDRNRLGRAGLDYMPFIVDSRRWQLTNYCFEEVSRSGEFPERGVEAASDILRSPNNLVVTKDWARLLGRLRRQPFARFPRSHSGTSKFQHFCGLFLLDASPDAVNEFKREPVGANLGQSFDQRQQARVKDCHRRRPFLQLCEE